MIVGYARTSTLQQVAGFEAQVRDLTQIGAERIFKEQVSSIAEREELNAALEFVRDGDTFVVTKLDRLARSTQHLLEIVATLEAKGVNLRILDMELDTGTATGRMMLTVMSAMGQFEREMMLERQREGIAKARAAGKFKGRPKMRADKAAKIVELKAAGIGAAKIAQEVGVGRATVYRILSEKT